MYYFLEDVFPNRPGGRKLLMTPELLWEQKHSTCTKVNVVVCFSVWRGPFLPLQASHVWPTGQPGVSSCPGGAAGWRPATQLTPRRWGGSNAGRCGFTQRQFRCRRTKVSNTRVSVVFVWAPRIHADLGGSSTFTQQMCKKGRKEEDGWKIVRGKRIRCFC